MGLIAIQNTNSLSNQEWINKVTSKGETSESVFKIFQQYLLKESLNKAIQAHNDWALELGK